MDCRKCNRLLQAYLDGDLDGSPYREVADHLDKCPDCRAEYDRMLKMHDLLRNLRELEVPEGEKEAFIGALRDRIAAERSREVQKGFNWRPVLVTAIAVVAVLIVTVLIPRPKGDIDIAPAPGFNAIENFRIDLLVVGPLKDHLLGTQADFMADPGLTIGSVMTAEKIRKNTHEELILPAEQTDSD